MKYLFIVAFIFTSSFCNYKELLFNGNCVTCHGLNNLNKSAPTIQEIKQRYISAFPEKKDFVEYMSTWVYKPDANTSLMMDAIEKYELMPELAFDKTTLEEIAEYIYESEFK